MTKRAERKFVMSYDETIYLEAYGEGAAVVFTHGLGGNHAIWYQQVTAFADRYRVVTWDQRGFGRSSIHTGRIGPEVSAIDLEAVMDSLGIEEAHLIGQSMGGYAVLDFALRNPRRVKTLVLGDTNAGIFTERIKDILEDYMKKAGSPLSVYGYPVGPHPALGERLWRTDVSRAFLYEQIGGMAGDPPADIVSRFGGTAIQKDLLKAVAAPVLLIAGSLDPMFPPQVVQEVSSLFPNSQVRIIDDAGHSPYFESPDEWNREVLQFLGSS